jgi:hypothetical protein
MVISIKEMSAGVIVTSKTFVAYGNSQNSEVCLLEMVEDRCFGVVLNDPQNNNKYIIIYMIPSAMGTPLKGWLCVPFIRSKAILRLKNKVYFY